MYIINKMKGHISLSVKQHCFNKKPLKQECSIF